MYIENCNTESIAHKIVILAPLFLLGTFFMGMEKSHDGEKPSIDKPNIIVRYSDDHRAQSIGTYREARLYAVRKGPWKAHFITQSSYVKGEKPIKHTPPELYTLEVDPSEMYNIAKKHPEVIADIRKEVARHKENLVRREDQLVPIKKGINLPSNK